MKSKKRVLVFPCGSEIGLEIYRSLSASIHFELIGGSSTPDHGEFVYKNYVSDIPFVSSGNFLEAINKVVDEQNIDFIFPAHDSVVLALAQAKAAGNLRCEVVTSPVATCETARSKKKTYETFADILPTPKMYQRDNVAPSDLPVFLKPDVGQGAQGTHLAASLEDVNFYTKKDKALLVLEYLPGKEFTVDCFTNNQGELLFVQGRERTRISSGISVNSSKVVDDRFHKLAKVINETLDFRGVWFFQVKEKNKELVLMEIAPRIAGTMGLVRCQGVNLPLLSLFQALDYDVKIFKNDYELTIDRSLHNLYRHNLQYNHVYLDLDDLVLHEGRVSPTVMAFVYQCVNRKITIHLLTKHKEDLTTTLKKHRLNEVFDEVIWVKNDDQKPEYIKEKDAIFIDDSFSERAAVHEKLRIPVFDFHMLESLLEDF